MLIAENNTDILWGHERSGRGFETISFPTTVMKPAVGGLECVVFVFHIRTENT
jgi:hypothetical protein